MRERVAHRLSGVPLEGLAPTLLLNRDVTIELDGVGNVQAFNLPGIAEIQPVVWLLMLKPIMDGLQITRQVTLQTGSAPDINTIDTQRRCFVRLAKKH